MKFYLDNELLGEVTEAPFEWICNRRGTSYAVVYDNAGNQAISNEVPVSTSQSKQAGVAQVKTVQRLQTRGGVKTLSLSLFLEGILWIERVERNP